MDDSAEDRGRLPAHAVVVIRKRRKGTVHTFAQQSNAGNAMKVFAKKRAKV